jgi:hypothetical protein
MTISSDSRVERDPAHFTASTGERELAVMSVEQGAYYGLNEVAARIWQLVDQARNVGSICAALQAEYAIEAGRCEREVIACLEALAAEGLIRVVDA